MEDHAPTSQASSNGLHVAAAGTVLGCTLWIVLLGMDVTKTTGSPVGGTVVAFGLGAGLGGWLLLKQRGSLGERRVLRRIIAVSALAGFLSLLALQLSGHSLISLGYLPALTGGWPWAVLGSGYPLLAIYLVADWQVRKRHP